METKALYMMLTKLFSTVLAASIQNYKIAALMALTLPMVYTNAVLLILHT
jgi:hypothetical protein